MVVRPFRGAVQLGDVPGPDLVRVGCGELGFDGGGMDGLAAALAGLARGAQQPVVRGLGAQAGALIQQDGPDLGRGQVSEPRAARRVQDRRPLRRGQCPRLGPVAVRHGLRAGAAEAIRCRRYQEACATPAARQAARVPVRSAMAVMAWSVARSARARCPRPRRSSPRAPEVLTGRLPRSGPWPAPAPAWPSLSAAGSFCSRAICASRGSAAGRPRGCFSPASAPVSRARRHSLIRLEYRPSRRKIAPFSPSGAAS